MIIKFQFQEMDQWLNFNHFLKSDLIFLSPPSYSYRLIQQGGQSPAKELLRLKIIHLVLL